MKKNLFLSAAVLSLAAAVTLPACISADDNVVLGEYKGVQVQKVSGIPEITEDAIDNNIQIILNGFAEKKEVDRPAREGDAVLIDYTVTVDDEPVEGAGMVDLEITIGGTPIFTGFDTSLIGKKAGDTYTLEHEYSPTYAVKELAGNTAVFHITVNAVEEITLPDLTDDFVQKVSSKSDTVEEYREEVRGVLEETNKEYIYNELKDTVWQKVIENAEVKEWPEDLLQEEKDSFYAYYQAGADKYEMSFDDFLEKLQISKESFEEQADASARSNVRENLVAAAIAEAESLELTDKEYEAGFEELASELGFDSVDDMKAEAPSEQYLKNMVLRKHVIEWLVENCEQVEKEAS